MAWLSEGERFFLAFNRDEAVARSAALPPSQREGERSFIAPQDPVGGGTWLAVSDEGTCFALLNNYQASAAKATSAPARSRGEVVWQLAGSRDWSEQWKTIEAGIDDYAPFHLLVLQKNEVLLRNWDGKQMEEGSLDSQLGVFSSSSLLTKPAIAIREKSFWNYWKNRHEQGIRMLQSFLDGRADDDRETSPMTDRGDRRTVSQSQIEIGGSKIAFRYRECQGSLESVGPWQNVVLDRKCNS
ncbi:MAG: NRDE family protein [Verrucomicrobiota bacterium JB023]|nr:NRDE family protein [Verrucomicrobiota bacterium JB023]